MVKHWLNLNLEKLWLNIDKTLTCLTLVKSWLNNSKTKTWLNLK